MSKKKVDPISDDGIKSLSNMQRDDPDDFYGYLADSWESIKVRIKKDRREMAVMREIIEATKTALGRDTGAKPYSRIVLEVDLQRIDGLIKEWEK